jgi:cytochrome c551/c552
MMKLKFRRPLVLLFALAGLVACEEKVDYKAAERAADNMVVDVDQDLRTAEAAHRMPLLAVRLGCTACHALDHAIVGPAWQNIGKRYAGAASFEYQGKQYPLTEGLVQKISLGGKNNWGSDPMPPMDPTGAKHGELGKLVEFILAQGKQP